MTLALVAPGVCTDTTLPLAVRDDLLSGANNGVWLFDLSRTFSYPSQIAPVNAALVKDLAGESDGDMIVQAGAAISFAGKGLDFTGVHSAPNGVRAPASVLNAIWTAGQHFMVCAYVKLPTLADWPSVVGSINSIFDSRDISTNPNPVCLMLVRGGTGLLEIWARRWITGATYADIVVAQANIPVGEFVQIAVWRSLTGQYGIRLKSASLSYSKTDGSTAASTTDWTGQRMVFGIGKGNTNTSNNFIYRMYRGFIENFDVTLRDPVTVLDADWTRITAANPFS